MLRTLGILLTLTALAMGQAMVQHAAAAAGGAAAAAGSKTVASGLEKMLGQAATTTSAAAAAPAPARAAAPNPVVVKHGKPSPFAAKVNRDGGSELAPVLPPLGHGRADDDGETAVIPASGEAARGNLWMPRRPRQQESVSPFSPSVSVEGGPVTRSRGGRGANPPQLANAAEPAMPSAMLTAVIVPPPLPMVLATPEKFASILPGATLESVIAQLGKPAAKISMYDDGKINETLRIEARGVRLGTIRLVDGVVSAVEPATL